MNEMILAQIEVERENQDRRFGEQNHPITKMSHKYATSVADSCKEDYEQQKLGGCITWETVLLEEVYEALEAAAAKDIKACRTELIQVAAVVVAMIECLDRNGLK